MEYKSIDTLSITECCELLNISREDLPDAIQNINAPTEYDNLIIDRLTKLLEEDRSVIDSCNTIEGYERYLSECSDGLYRETASQRLEQLYADITETSFYNSNKETIVGCRAYLQGYPNGKYVAEVKKTLEGKIRARSMRNIILFAVIIILVVIVSLMNYNRASYLNIIGDTSFGKRGGDKYLCILTDAIDKNVDYILDESGNWLNVLHNGDTMFISAGPNMEAEKTAYITVNAYSSFFGKRIGCISEKVKIEQISGLPTFLKTNKSEVTFDKYGKSSSNIITAETDGCDLKISATHQWISVTKDVETDDNNIVASIKITADTNVEGGKSGEVIISCNNYVKRIKVSQESGLATRFELGTYNLIMAEEGSGEGFIYPVSVYTDGTSWSVKSAPDWLTAYADIEEKRLEVSVDANTGQIQTGTITLMSNNGDLKDISVSQDGDPTNFGTAKSTIKFGTSSDYEYVTIYNDSRKQLSISEYESWISASVIDKNRIKISCDSNYDDPPKSGTVYVSCGDEQVSITVKQDGWSKCRRCGGDGELDCPNNGRGNFPQCVFQYENGIHYFVEWPMAMGIAAHMKRYEICNACRGSGHVECPDCDGEGKSYKSY